MLGSISHTAGYCAVVVDHHAEGVYLGFDVEHEGQLSPEALPLVCRPRELGWLARQAKQLRSQLATLVFSAKEAYYKAQFPATAVWLDFLEVEIDVDLGARAFRALPTSHHRYGNNPVPALAGRFAFRDGLVLCGIQGHSL